MNKWQVLGSGFVGACALTLLHEGARRVIPHAPRMDVMGKRSIVKVMEFAGYEPPDEERLHKLALVGDIVSNSLYYSSIAEGSRDKLWLRGALVGLGAGLGAAFLPKPLRLGRQPDERKPITQLLTVLWYLVGGLATAAAASVMSAETSGATDNAEDNFGA